MIRNLGAFRLTLAVVLAGLVFVLYEPSRHYGFSLWDDPTYVLNDPATQYFSLEHLEMAFTTVRDAVWYPLARISHSIDMSLFGRDASAHRTVNIALHAGNSLLVFFILLRLSALRQLKDSFTQQSWLYGSGLVALLFAVHPQQVEVVVWISQRKELLSTLFALLSIYCHCLYRFGNAQARHWLAACLLCGGLAMLAKPMTVTLPLLLVAMDLLLWRDPRLTLMVSLREKFLLFIAGLLVGLTVIYTHKTHSAQSLDDYYSLFQRLQYASWNYLHTLWLWLVPIQLAPVKQVPELIQQGGFTLWIFAVPVVLGAIVLLAWRYAYSGMALCLVWYLISYMPVSGITMFGTYSPGDRYAYFSTLPLFVLLVFFPLWLLKPHALSLPLRRLAFAVLILLSVCYAAWLVTANHNYLKLWRDDVTLWKEVTRRYPNNGASRMIYGMVLHVHGDQQQAIEQCGMALELGPLFVDYPVFDCYEIRFSAYMRQGEYYLAAQELKHYLEWLPQDARIMNLYGFAILLCCEEEIGLRVYRQAWQLHPQLTDYLMQQHSKNLLAMHLDARAAALGSLRRALSASAAAPKAPE